MTFTIPTRGLPHPELNFIPGPIEYLIASMRSDLASSPVIVLGVLAAMGLFGVLTLRGSRVAAVVLIGLGAVWPVINGRVEGPTLLALSWNHGISAADLLSVAAVLLAGWRLLLPTRAPRYS